jgi:hypothetical protein
MHLETENNQKPSEIQRIIILPAFGVLGFAIPINWNSSLKIEVLRIHKMNLEFTAQPNLRLICIFIIELTFLMSYK